MADEYNNNDVNPENIGNENINPEQNNIQDQNAPVNETPAQEPKKEEAHTSIPGSNQNQYIYNAYQANGGQQYGQTYNGGYRYGQQNNAYGNPNYNRQQYNRPDNQNYNYGYYNNYNYGYQNTQQPNQQQYQQNYQQQFRPVQQPAQQQPKKSGGGKIAAIIAVCVAVAVIFAVVGIAAGYLLARPGNQLSDKPSSSDSTPSNPAETKDNSSDHKVPETTTPLTDPNAKINTSVSGESLPMTEAAAKAVDSVVEISTEQTVQGSFMQQYVVQGGGSGIIITEDGYIATNNHVIEDASQIKITLRNGETYNGTLVGTDAQADLAVVKIDATGLKPATFGDSSKLVVAEAVIAIGNPLGELGGTVTQGIISALERTITIENQEMTLLQTTAAINPGNSGGGLFNLAGECVGIVNAKSSGSGIEGLAFAIPSNSAVKVIEDLMQYGYVRGRVMLGISMLEITDQYTLYRSGLDEYGVYVSKVYEDSDAEKYGIKQKDRLVSIDGTKVDSAATARKLIQGHSVGDTVSIVVSRDGRETTVNVKLSEYVPNKNELS